MTKREKQLYKSGRKNPDGFSKTPLILRIKYNKKFLVYSVVVLLFSVVINFILLFNFLSPSELYSKLGIIDGIEKQNSDFAIYYLDVGQSDCSIITCDDKVMMIDSGTRSQDIKIRAALFILDIDKIDYLVITHPHDDHMGSAAEIIKRFNVECIIMPKISSENSVETLTYSNLIYSIAKNNVNPFTVVSGDKINLGKGVVDFLAPYEQTDDLNNMSIVLKVTYGDTSFLFQGDAEETIENKIIKSNLDVSADVIKVGHHGSNTSTNEKYLDQVNPSIAIVSCGSDNNYKHPNKQTIDILEEHNIKTYVTSYNGNIIATSDGKTVNILCENKNT